jgi:hypothetical protein
MNPSQKNCLKANPKTARKTLVAGKQDSSVNFNLFALIRPEVFIFDNLK